MRYVHLTNDCIFNEKNLEQMMKIEKEFAKEFNEPEPVICCYIEGKSHNEIMQKYYDHMDWGTYHPMEQE